MKTAKSRAPRGQTFLNSCVGLKRTGKNACPPGLSRLCGSPGPHPDYPRCARANGQWTKGILGKVHDFSRWSDLEAALQECLKRALFQFCRTAVNRLNGCGGRLTDRFVLVTHCLLKGWNRFFGQRAQPAQGFRSATPGHGQVAGQTSRQNGHRLRGKLR